MKNHLIAFIFCFLSALLSSWIIHWQLGLVAVFVIMAIYKPSALQAFFIGFMAVFIAWAGTALYLSLSNQHLLANQIGDLFGGISPLGLVLLVGVLGGLAGGLVASSAAVIFGRKFEKIGL